MSRTIGAHRPKNSPRGDVAIMCDYCGVVWLRSRMWMDEQGLWNCPDEGDGRDAVMLSRLVAQDSARPKRAITFPDGGSIDRSDDPPAGGTPAPYNPRLP